MKSETVESLPAVNDVVNFSVTKGIEKIITTYSKHIPKHWALKSQVATCWIYNSLIEQIIYYLLQIIARNMHV